MSDTNEEIENDVVEADQSTEEQTEESTDQGNDTQENEGKEGREWVEFTPEQQKKFNDMYKQTKMSDSRNQMLTKMLEEQQKQLDELKSRFSKTDEAEAERILKERIQEARDAGDLEQEVKLFKELASFEKGPKLKENKVPDITNDPDTKYVLALAQEVDDRGEPTRPWLNDKHPQYRSMLTKANIIVAELEADGEEATVPAVMKILDERMKKTPPSRGPSPMERGNLTTGKNGPNIRPKLSAQEKDIARKLGMSEADYLDGKQMYGAKR